MHAAIKLCLGPPSKAGSKMPYTRVCRFQSFGTKVSTLVVYKGQHQSLTYCCTTNFGKADTLVS